MLYHNFCHSKLRYSEAMILARTCTNNDFGKDDIADALVNEKFSNSGILVVTDRGYCTLATLRYFSQKNIPFMGTIQQRQNFAFYHFFSFFEQNFFVQKRFFSFFEQILFLSKFRFSVKSFLKFICSKKTYFFLEQKLFYRFLDILVAISPFSQKTLANPGILQKDSTRFGLKTSQFFYIVFMTIQEKIPF